MEDGALTFEHLEDEILGDEDDHVATTTTMPPPSVTLFPDAPFFPRGSTSQPPPASARGGHAGPSLGRGLLPPKLYFVVFYQVSLVNRAQG